MNNNIFNTIHRKFNEGKYNYIMNDMHVLDRDIRKNDVAVKCMVYEMAKLSNDISNKCCDNISNDCDKIIKTKTDYRECNLNFQALFNLPKEYKHPICGFSLVITGFAFNACHLQMMFLDNNSHLFDSEYVDDLLDCQGGEIRFLNLNSCDIIEEIIRVHNILLSLPLN